MKYILIKGITEAGEGWGSKLYQYLDCRPEDVIEVVWDEQLSYSWFNRLQNALAFNTAPARGLSDQPNDVVRYFCDNRLREGIIDKVVMAMYLCNEPFTIVGHSLGSVIAMEAVATALMVDLYCFGLVTLNPPDVMHLVRRPNNVKLPWWNVSHNVVVNGATVTLSPQESSTMEAGLEMVRPYLKAAQKA